MSILRSSAEYHAVPCAGCCLKSDAGRALSETLTRTHQNAAAAGMTGALHTWSHDPGHSG